MAGDCGSEENQPTHAMAAHPATGLRRKILIFTEPKDTLEYLQRLDQQRAGIWRRVPAPPGLSMNLRPFGE
jgi:hypothetical protein